MWEKLEKARARLQEATQEEIRIVRQLAGLTKSLHEEVYKAERLYLESLGVTTKYVGRDEPLFMSYYEVYVDKQFMGRYDRDMYYKLFDDVRAAELRGDLPRKPKGIISI
jgi:hypothetical protein